MIVKASQGWIPRARRNIMIVTDVTITYNLHKYAEIIIKSKEERKFKILSKFKAVRF